MGILQNIMAAIAQGTGAPGATQAAPTPVNTLQSILTPAPGSFWASALQNGLANARTGQVAYQQSQQDIAAKQAAAAQALRAGDQTYVTGKIGQEQKAQDLITNQIDQTQKAQNLMQDKQGLMTAGGNIVRVAPDGTVTPVYTPTAPTPPPTENERLLQKWIDTPPGPLKDLLEKMLKGYQYSTEYLNQLTDSKKAVAGVVHRSVSSSTSTSNTGTSKGVPLPPGATLDPIPGR